MATLKDKLAIAESALQELEDQLGAPFQSLRTASAIEAHFTALDGHREKPDLAEEAAARRMISSITSCLGNPDVEGSALSQLTIAARDLLDEYDEVFARCEEWGNSGAEIVGADLLPYVERLRARFPGHNDRMVAQSIFHFERRGGELQALPIDEGWCDLPKPERL